jgi:hypothetical protein
MNEWMNVWKDWSAEEAGGGGSEYTEDSSHPPHKAPLQLLAACLSGIFCDDRVELP